VDVNPRFGKLDFKTGAIVPLAYSWIVNDTPPAS